MGRRPLCPGAGRCTENRPPRGWAWRGAGGARGRRAPAPGRGPPRSAAPPPPSWLLSPRLLSPRLLPSPSGTLLRRSGFGLQPLNVSSWHVEDAHLAQSPRPWGESSWLRDPDLGLESRDGAGGSMNISGWEGSCQACGRPDQVRGWHRHVPGGPPSSWKRGQGLQRPEPGSDPFHGHSGPVFLQPEPAAPFLRQPRRPPLGCAGRRGVHPAPGPSPGPEGPPHGVHSKPPGVGPPEPALLVWTCLPSGWDAPGKGARSALTPVSPGPVRFVH